MRKQKGNKKLKGISGWLLVYTIILIMLSLEFVIDSLLFLFLLGPILKDIIAEGELLTFVLGVGITILFAIFSVFILFLEFKNKKEFPKWAIVHIWTLLIVGIIADLLYWGEYDVPIIETGLVIVVSWYLSVSNRVKNTFVK